VVWVSSDELFVGVDVDVVVVSPGRIVVDRNGTGGALAEGSVLLRGIG